MPTISNARKAGKPNPEGTKLYNRVRRLFFGLLDEWNASELIEIGCHDAETSARFVTDRPARKAFAIEAIPAICERAATMHADKPIEFLQLALGRRNGNATFFVPSDDRQKAWGWGTLKKRNDADIQYDEIQVEMLTLTTAATRLGLDHGDRSAAIWMDVEGAQLDIVEGGMAFLSRKVAIIYTELYDNRVFNDAGTSITVVQRLLECGFIPIARDNQFAKGYNLIAVHREVYDRCIDTITQFIMSSHRSLQQ